MSKNIIICCDGTGNKFGKNNSNVVHIYSILDDGNPTNRKESDQQNLIRQIAYYDPGVGTLADTGLWSPIKKKLSLILGNAFGRGLQKNVEEAYSFLMEKYEEGDKIFLFGFSRGAYATRVLTGFIHMVGLLEPGLQNLIPYAYEIYSNRKLKTSDRWSIAARFKYTYSRKVPIHFLGIWDTVSSVGWIGNFHTYPYTSNNPDIKILRHALAVDEKRTFFMNSLLGEKPESKKDMKQVWFAGVHSDVGGSYPEQESGLAKCALEWMVREAKIAGLQINEKRYNKIVLGQGSKDYIGPDHTMAAHESLTGSWWVAEYLPRKVVTYNPEKTIRRFIPKGRRREIPENSLIHVSVLNRKRDTDYDPPNIPDNFRVEE